jgi:NAD(P)H-dependent FMN reductase
MNPVVARWFLGLLGAHGGFQVDLIDPAEVSPEELTGRLTRAEGFVIVTPEYNHSFPAPLKELIDAHVLPWMAKPVAFVSYGGISGGLRAIEHLRGVLAELHAVTLRDTVSLHLAWELVDDTGELEPEPAAEVAVKVLLDRLVWWTTALTDARAQYPYAA